ncbi:hypothetical protein FOA61_23375 [Escherichia coli]|nr:hypothetical protein [Escherichia coli]EFB6143468.1 hypothetical protein [Escherichia coli]EFD7619306.1 hypothetical protein [Escherichia coli]EFD7623250.1 hypothetical protein [Escherichia coli]
MFAGKKSAQIREILISESAWEEMTCLFAPSLTNGWSALESIFEHYLDYIIDNNKNLIPIQEVMPIIGWNELEKISLEYITGKVNAIVSKLIQENQLKAYDDDVLKNLLNGWFMHIAIHAKNLKELADKKGQFIAIYRGFLLSLKDK